MKSFLKNLKLIIGIGLFMAGLTFMYLDQPVVPDQQAIPQEVVYIASDQTQTPLIVQAMNPVPDVEAHFIQDVVQQSPGQIIQDTSSQVLEWILVLIAIIELFLRINPNWEYNTPAGKAIKWLYAISEFLNRNKKRTTTA